VFLYSPFAEGIEIPGQTGNRVDFGEKLQKVIDSYGDLKDRLIFLTDGATWIREWIAGHYPFVFFCNRIFPL
jgi:hypothetical protein